MTDHSYQSHPEELLEAYALDALEEGEALSVEAHLDGCLQCGQIAEQLQQDAAMLGRSVEQQAPPPRLATAIMTSLPDQEEVPTVYANGATASRSIIGSTGWVLPLAATIVISLFSVSLVMNLRISDRVDQLQQENSTMVAQLGQNTTQTQGLQKDNSVLSDQLDQTVAALGQSTNQTQGLEEKSSVLSARLDQSLAQEQVILGTVRQMQVASYLSAHPDTQPLVLEPPSGAGSSQGVLLVAKDGRRAILMVSNMEQPPPSRSYQAWLVKDGYRMPVGALQVDSSGWGTLTLIPPEPVFGFDWVNLTVEDQRGGAVSTMVLRSRIPPNGYAR